MKKSIITTACLLLLLQSTFAADGIYKIEYKKGKAGVIYQEATITKWVLPAIYDTIILRHNYSNVFIFQIFKNNKTGIFRTAELDNCKITLSCDYPELLFFDDGFFAVREGNKWGVFDAAEKNDWLLPIDMDEVKMNHDHGSDIVFVKKNSKFGLYLLPQSQWLLEPIYDEITRPTGDVAFVSNNGKMGAYNLYQFRPGRYLGSWLIPIKDYEKVYHTSPISTFLLVDSAGNKGVWQYKDGINSWRVIGADRYTDLVYNQTDNEILLKKDNIKGVLSGRGWIISPHANHGDGPISRTYTLYNTKVRIDLNKGVHFRINCSTSPYESSIDISDPSSYDSFYLEKGILYGIKNNKISAHLLHFDMILESNLPIAKNGLRPLTSELLFRDVDSCFKVAKKATGMVEASINYSVAYFKDGKWGFWYLISGYMVKVKAQAGTLKVDQWDQNFENFHSNWPIMLVAINKKWGVISSEGKIVVPLVHQSFLTVDSETILFKSPEKDRWRLFSARNAPALNQFHPEWGALRLFAHNNEVRVDFNSRKMKGVNEIITLDQKEYFIHKGFTNLDRVKWFTSGDPVNKGVTGDVIKEFENGGFDYYVRKKATGIGLYQDNLEKIAPYLENISIAKAEAERGRTFTKVILQDKHWKSDIYLDAEDLKNDFVPSDFIVRSDKITCTKCSGKGGEEFTSTKTIKGQTKSTTTPKTEYKETYEQVWDTRTNTYKSVKKMKPVTTYETKTEKASDRQETVTGINNCTQCKGVGYLRNAKFHCTIGKNGLEIGELVDPSIK